jgi:hypothetical protein
VQAHLEAEHADVTTVDEPFPPLMATSDRRRNVPSQTRTLLVILVTHLDGVARRHEGTGGGGSPGDPATRTGIGGKGN